MKLNDRKLVIELGIVLIIKVILLYGIWVYWIAGKSVKVDASSAASHILSTPP
jgi:predicted negative regulator of RcsB-dependent stress response